MARGPEPVSTPPPSNGGRGYSEGLGDITRYLVLAAVALNSDGQTRVDNAALANEIERVEQAEAESRIQQVIEKNRAENRQASEMQSRADESTSGDLRSAG